MLNPESSFHTIDTATMFCYSTHKNIPWTLPQYRTPRLEVDAGLEVQKRKWLTQKKGQKDGRYVTKKGFYMDYQLKVAKGVPAPTAHNEQKSWDFQKLRKKGSSLKVDRTLSKSTYLDFIQLSQRNRKSPGVSTYNIEKSLQEKEEAAKTSTKKPSSIGDRIFFYQNTESLSNIVPGAGNYCPHPISPHVSPERKDYKYWVAKHKAENEKLLKRQSLRPAPGTHSPLNTTLRTFEQISLSPRQTKTNCFGTDAKFQYTRPTKKKIIQKRPDPAVHSTIIQWKGKGISPKKTTLDQAVWRGHSSSIYH